MSEKVKPKGGCSKQPQLAKHRCHKINAQIRLSKTKYEKYRLDFDFIRSIELTESCKSEQRSVQCKLKLRAQPSQCR